MVASAPRCPPRLILTISSNRSTGSLSCQPTARHSCCQCGSLSGHPSSSMLPFGFRGRRGGLMKAILFHQHGGPDVLKYEDAPEPALRGLDVLVRVKACALNHLDLWVRRGLPNVPIPLPHIPGSDIAGEVAKIGADVTAIREIGRASGR